MTAPDERPVPPQSKGRAETNGGQTHELLVPELRIPRERADAARNRERVLHAAERLFASGDPTAVTMGDIAHAAGIGRATLYRRYPDPASIAIALLDAHEQRLQQQLLNGDPPLGPGATPAARLAAFYHAMVTLLDQHLHLALRGESGRDRFTSGAYGFWRLHVRSLLMQAEVVDPESLIDTLLAPLDPETYRHQRDDRGLPPERIAHALTWQAHRLLDPTNATR